MAEQTSEDDSPLVLIVDADDHERLLLCAVLQRDGCKVAAATDAVAGLRMAVRLRPDVVVLDARLPGGDAEVVLKRVHALPALAGTPVVVMERRRLPYGLEAAATPGGVTYLSKPFDPDDLSCAVRTALGEDAVCGPRVVRHHGRQAARLRLGEILMDMGAVTDEQLREALARQPRLGQVLEDIGMVSHEQVEAALDRQKELAAEESAARSSAGKAVLIVDDDEELLAVLAASLRRAGLEVAVATDAVSATSTALRTPPDVVLMDIGLPGGDGVTVMQRLHALPRLAGVPVVMLSGRDPRQYRDRAIDAGAVGYLVKPVRPDDLVATLHAALDGTLGQG